MSTPMVATPPKPVVRPNAETVAEEQAARLFAAIDAYVNVAFGKIISDILDQVLALQDRVRALEARKP